MIIPPNVSSPMVGCAASQPWISHVESHNKSRDTLLQRSTCMALAQEESSPYNQTMSQLQHRNFVQTAKKTRGTAAANLAMPMEIHRRCSVTFDEVVRVRTVSYATSAATVDRLWYQKADYQRFRAKIGTLITLAKKYRQQHRKSIHMPGMEKFLVDDTDASVASGHPSTSLLRSQAMDCVLMEQFCQRQQGHINEERIAALCRLTTRRAKVMAWERAAAVRISNTYDDIVASTTLTKKKDRH
jgi:hypothetical protein